MVQSRTAITKLAPSGVVAYSKVGDRVKPPGKPVGVIAVQPKGLKPDEFNPLVLFFTVNPYRRDFNKVVDQTNKKPKLSKYGQDLFNSCFKNW